MERINPKALAAYCKAVLSGYGVADTCAEITADCLVDADLCGIPTHGVSRLAIYLERIQAGVVAKDDRIMVLRESPAALTVDAGNSLGMPAGKFAMEHCMGKAAQAGCCFATVKNSNHFGTAAYYTRLAAGGGMVGICASNLTGKIAPHGAAEPYMGTNPISIAVPGPDGPVALDMAPSVVALGKLILADKTGQSIPLGWALDQEGKPTTDPKEGRKGSLVPIGGAKGSGLAIMIDILCGILSGGQFGPHINDLYGDLKNPQEVGHFMGAIDISHFVPLEEFRQRVGQMIAEIKQLRLAEGFDAILMPGERSLTCRKENLAAGIALPPEVLADLVQFGQRVGVLLPDDFFVLGRDPGGESTGWN